MQINDIIHGFKFTSQRPLPELSATLWEATYIKNGARLLFIEREESNKTFAITFKTIPEDDTGVFHILEHSVLCGSEKYPVKEPFVELLKGSLKTFLNAFTFPDKTMYPVSSRNDKDFLNLIDVYMDATLHPLALTRPEIFMQEGWHYEVGEDGELSYKGVVFNEMKGAYSSADEMEMELISSLLYSGTPYARDSGGNPEHITDLTYEQFVAAHTRYYHPSNAKIVLDGAVDIDKTLATLDSFLCEYDALEINTDIPRVVHNGHTERTVKYEIGEGDDPAGKCRICLGFMSVDHTERKELTALSLITDAIAGTNDAPFKKRMLASGLCEDASFISYDGVQENALMIEIKNVREEDIKKAEELAFETIADIVRTGIDREALVAAFNSMEFREREQDGAGMPTGISYAITAMDAWLYGADPMISLSFESEFQYLRAALDTDYYEKLLERVILNSTHSAALYMIPDTTLGEERRAKEAAKLAAAKAAMSSEEMARIKCQHENLVAWQSEDDSDEALATLPRLTVEDICDRPEPIPNEIYTLSGIPALYTSAATRGITYTNLLFDITDFTADELFLASLLTELFKNLATDSTDAVALQTKIKTNLGAFNTSILVAARDGQPRVYMQVSVSALDSNLSSVKPIAEDVLLHTAFDDKDAIGKIVKQLRTSTADSIAASGHGVAFARCASYTSAEAAVLEYTDGIEFYLNLKALERDFGNKYESFAKSLDAVRAKIFTRSRLTACHTGNRRDEYVEQLAAVFPEGSAIVESSPIKPFGARREGVLIPAAVSYLGYAANALRYVDRMHGSFGVIRTLLSYGYLWGEIRVQGGAYGAGFIKRQNGNAGIYTYRDPDAKRSVEKAKGCPEYLRAIAASGEDLTTYIIGAVGDSDTLLSPRVLTALSVSTYLRGETYEDRLTARREMIATSSKDLLAAADVIEKMLAENCYTVVGGKDKLTAFGDALDAIIEI